MNRFKLQHKTAWAEDRATQRCDPSADPGAKTEGGAVDAHCSAPLLPLRDWRPSAKPSRQDAVTLRQEVALQPANVKPNGFQFAVNQDKSLSIHSPENLDQQPVDPRSLQLS